MSQQNVPKAKAAGHSKWSVVTRVLGVIAGLIALLAGLATISGFNLATIFSSITSASQAPTATHAQSAPYTYIARVPGCPGASGRWVKAAGSIKCLPDRLELSTDASQGIGQVFFYGDRRLPTNNKVDVDIDSLSVGACAGVIVRNADSRKGGYAYQACADGHWLIVKYDLTDTPFPLLKGTDDHRATFHLAAVTQGNNLLFSLDGHEVGHVQEGELTDTDSVSLFVTPTASGAGQAQASFQNFAFTELLAPTALLD